MMAIENAIGLGEGTGTQVVRSNGTGNLPTMEDVETCALPVISGATYATIGEFNIANMTSGVITGCGLSDGGSGTVDVASGTIMIRTTASDVGAIVSANFAGDTGVALTDNSINFVFIDYNSGTPQIGVTTAPSFSPQDNVIVGLVWREGTDIFISEVNIPTGQTGQKLARRLALVDGVTRQSGGVVGESGTNNVTLTAGTWWLALKTYATTSLDTSSSGSWIGYYRDAGSGWTAQAAQTTISNLLYDDDSGTLATLGNNRYGVHWVYVSIEDQVYVVYGQGSYNLTEAETAHSPATLPLQVSPLHAILLAKIIIQKSASSFTEIESAFDTVFQSALAQDHDSLSGLQGGTADEYYHLTSAEYGLTGVLTGNGASIMSASTITEDGTLIAGASNAVASLGVAANGQLVVGSTGATPVVASVASTDGSLTITEGAGTLVIEGTAASDSQVGSVELATDTETNTGTSTVLAITPANVTAWTGSTALVTLGTVTTGVWTGTTIVVANGGTGAETLTGVVTGNGTSAMTANAITEHGVLFGGASNAVGSTDAGTAGEVMTSGGAGVDPDWAAGGGGGAWSLITSTTVSNDASISFISLTVGGTYRFVIETLQPASNGTQLEMLMSTDNGSSYLSSNYTWLSRSQEDGDVNTTSNNSDAQIDLTTRGMGTATGESVCGEINFWHPAQATEYHLCQFDITQYDANGALCKETGAGANKTSTAIDAVRFTSTSGNLNTGIISLYKRSLS
jgi:hypothetical protein